MQRGLDLTDSGTGTAVLLVAHGSRRARANEEVVEAARRLDARFGAGPVVPCFLEIASPDIPSAFEKAAADGCRRITVVPFFLTSGAHVTKDIPAILEKCRARRPEIEVEITPAVGPDPGLDEIAMRRILDSSKDMEPIPRLPGRSSK